MPPPPPGHWRRHAARLVALALCVSAYGLTRRAPVPPAERGALAARFSFTSEALPIPPDAGQPRTSRQVHPALQRMAAWISTVGAAVSLEDLDGDGLPNDLCHVDPRFDRVLLAPAPGTGARFPPRVLDPRPLPWDPATMAPMGSLIGDFDEDGRADVLVYYWGRTPVWFRDPLGAAEPCEVSAVHARWFTNAAAATDVDGDGHVDLLFGNYFPDDSRILDASATDTAHMHDSMSRAENGGSKQLLLWTPSGFVPRNDAFPEAVRQSWTLALAAADLDGDLRPEVYLANDFGCDRMLHNRSTPGAPRFALVEGRERFDDPASCVLGHDSFKGMGVDFGDVDGDGHLDLFVSNISTEFGLMEAQLCFVSTGDTAALQEGRAPYRERGEELGLSRSGWAWDCRFADFDNDGGLEVVQAAGFVRGTVNRWPELHELAMGNDQLLAHPGSWPLFGTGDDLSGDRGLFFFARCRDGRFVDLAADLGMAGQAAGAPHVARGIAIADVDGDGALDFALAGQWEASRFYRNRLPGSSRALGLRLLLPLAGEVGATHVLARGQAAPESARPAIGAVVRLLAGDDEPARLPKVATAEVRCGGGHGGGGACEVHFGLGAAAPAAEVQVEVRWRDRSGRPRRERLSLPAGRHTVVLGTGQE